MAEKKSIEVTPTESMIQAGAKVFRHYCSDDKVLEALESIVEMIFKAMSEAETCDRDTQQR